MDLGRALALLRCPECGAELRAADAGAVCAGTPPHDFGSRDGLLCFAAPATPGASKYDPAYAARYAGLWAYGCETLHSGWDEPLYAVVAALVARALGRLGRPAPLIADCGCGVGRTTGDCAELAPRAGVLGFDLSLPMLALAQRITCDGPDSGPVTFDLGAFGLGERRVTPRGLGNVFLACADVTHLPLGAGCADVALSVNIIDRVPEPAEVLRECRRLLRDGGTLVFANPLNWIHADLWRRYPGRDAVLALIEQAGFRIDLWYDELPYKEIIDARGSFEHFSTLVVQATARP